MDKSESSRIRTYLTAHRKKRKECPRIDYHKLRTTANGDCRA